MYKKQVELRRLVFLQAFSNDQYIALLSRITAAKANFQFFRASVNYK